MYYRKITADAQANARLHNEMQLRGFLAAHSEALANSAALLAGVKGARIVHEINDAIADGEISPAGFGTGSANCSTSSSWRMFTMTAVRRQAALPRSILAILSSKPSACSQMAWPVRSERPIWKPSGACLSRSDTTTGTTTVAILLWQRCLTPV